MKFPKRIVAGVLVAALLSWAGAPSAIAKSYSSGGGHSYSSHSSSSGSSHSFSSGSHSFSSGSSSHSSSSGSSSSHSSSGTSTHSSGGSSTYSSGGGTSHTSTGSSSQRSGGSSGSGSSKSSSFTSGSGHSYSAGSGSSSSSGSSDRHSYTSGKSYSSGSGRNFSSGSSYDTGSGTAKSYGQSSTPASFTYDTAAAQARQQEVSKANYNEYKRSQSPPVVADRAPVTVAPTYQGKPPPVISSGGSYSRSTVYIPDSITFSTRRARIYNYYNPYYSRPWVTYNDPYNSFFWWWLLDRSLDDRAYWAYHHHYDMDPARYDALMATDQQLQTRVAQLEAQQAPRDTTYVPPGIDRDLMYSDQYVTHNYQNRPTRGGIVFFWILAVPCALAVVVFFIWLIWFKRWQPVA